MVVWLVMSAEKISQDGDFRLWMSHANYWFCCWLMWSITQCYFTAGRCECVSVCSIVGASAARGVVHFADELQHVGECRSGNMFDIFCFWATAFTQQVLSLILTHTFLSPSINKAPESKPKFNLKHSLI